MSRNVIYVRLQTEAYSKSSGSLGLVFPPQTKSLQNLVMTTHDVGLKIKFVYSAKETELLIPYANISIMELAPEDKPVSLKVAK